MALKKTTDRRYFVEKENVKIVDSYTWLYLIFYGIQNIPYNSMNDLTENKY